LRCVLLVYPTERKRERERNEECTVEERREERTEERRKRLVVRSDPLRPGLDLGRN
jgi:hypothetical protein